PCTHPHWSGRACIRAFTRSRIRYPYPGHRRHARGKESAWCHPGGSQLWRDGHHWRGWSGAGAHCSPGLSWYLPATWWRIDCRCLAGCYPDTPPTNNGRWLESRVSRHLPGGYRARSQLGALEGDATTPEDVRATSSSEESSDRVSETPYAHCLHRRWFLLLTHATPIATHIGEESTSSKGSGVASATVANWP